MKKNLLLVFALAFLAPWAMNAQTPNATVPYSTGFETGDDCNWDLIVGSVTNKWVIGTAEHNIGSRSLYISNDNGTTNAYTVNSASVCFAVRTFTITNTSNPYIVSFDWKATGESTFDYLRAFLVPASETFAAGTLPSDVSATGTPTGWIDLGGKMNLSSDSWMNTTVQFTLDSAGDYKLVFLWRNDGSLGTNPPAAVDNVQFAEVSCPAPTLAFASLTSTEATVTITSAATNFLVSMDGVNWELFTDNPLIIDTLTPQTNYMLRVKALCDGGDTSFASVLSFMAPCETIPVDSLPYVYGFEDATASGASASYSPCWGRHVIGTTSAYPYPSNTYKHSGTYSLYFYSTATVQSWSTLPPFETPVNNLYLTFWIYKSSAAYGHILVGVMSNPDDLSTFDTIAQFQANNLSTWEYVEVPLSSYTGNGGFITLLASTPALNYTYIDDITVSLPPACPRPTEVTASAITATSATLTWHNNASTASEYMVEYGLHGFTQGYGTLAQANDTTVALSNLRPGFSYDAYVIAICGDDTSTVALGTFTAGCAEIAASDLPYIEDFETYGTGAAYPINACWAKGTTATTAYPYPASAAAINGIRGLSFYGYTSSSAAYYSWAAMPPIEESLDMSDLMVRFNAKRYSSTSSTYKSIIMVGVADSMTDVSGVAWIDTIDLSPEAASSIHEIEVSFENYTGTGRYVVFYAPNPTMSGTSATSNYIYIDDVTLTTIPSCYRPVEVVVDQVGADQATLSWTPDERTSAPSSWNVEYGPHGFTLGNGDNESPSTNTVTLTNLTPNTWYDVYVSADCGGETSDARSVSFITGAEPADLPYFTGFEMDQDTDWVIYNVNCLNHWIIGNDTSAVASGNRALYITNNDHDYTYTIASSASTVFAIRYLNIEQGGDVAVSFDWKAYGESTFDYLRAFLVPSNITIVPGELNGIAPAVTPEGWINLGNYNDAVKLNLSSSWQTNTAVVNIPDSLAGVYKLVFFWRNDNSGGTQPPASVDNVVVSMLNCPTPQNLVATDLQPYQIELAWDDASDATSWQVRVNDGNWVDVSTNSYTATGLTPVTDYTFTVRAFCGSDSSFVSQALSVYTPRDCGDNSINIVDTIGFGTSAGATYAFYASSTYPRAVTEAIYTAQELTEMGLQVNNRINGIKMHSGATGGTIHQAKIYMKEVSLSNFDTPVADDSIDRSTMTLVYSGDLVVPASSWVEILFDSAFNYSGSNNLAIMFAHDTNSTAGVSFYATTTSPDYRNAYFYVSSTATTFSSGVRTYYRPNLVFDICTEVPNCARPTEVTVIGATDTSLTLTWTGAGNASSYEVLLSTTSVNPDTVTGLTTYTVVGDTITITGLTNNTAYYYYVRSLCGSIGNSEWSIEGNTRTDCGLLAVPYTEDFESFGSGSTNAISPCWTKGTNNSTAYPYPYSTNAVTGQRSLYFYAYQPSSATSTAYYCYAALPRFQEPVNNLMLNFNVRTYSTASAYYRTNLLVGVMTNPNDITTFTAVDTVNLVGAPALATYAVEVDFSHYTGAGQYIAIYDPVPTLDSGITYAYSYAYVDDVVVDVIPTCPRVLNLTASPMLTAATISWTDTSSNTGWNVEYGTSEFTPGTGVMTPIHVTDTFCVINGLDSATTYHVYVYPDCPDGNYYRYIAFNTLAASPANVPYYCNFEAAGVNGWDLINGTQINHWMVGNATNNGGSQSLYITNDDSSNAYTIASAISYVFATRAVNLTAGNYVCSFDWKAQGESSYDFIRAALVPVGTQFSAGSYCGFDKDSAMPAGAYALDGAHRLNLQGSSWNTQVTEFTLADPGIYNIVFLWRNDNSGGAQPPAAIDNVTLMLNTCPKVTELDTLSVGGNQIVIDWTDNAGASQWQVRYNDNTVIANAHPFTINGLDNMTGYTISVRPICGAADTGAWSSSLHITTTMCDNPTIVENWDSTMTAGTTTYAPIGYSLYNYSYVQTIIDSATLASAGLSGDINAFAFNAGTLTTGNTKYENMTVFMANVAEDNLANSWILPDSAHTFVKVIDSANFNFTESGWHAHAFDNTFTWDGHSNILFVVKRDNGSYSGSQTFTSHTTTGYKTRYAYRDPSAFDYTNPGVDGTAIQSTGDLRFIYCASGCNTPEVDSLIVGETDVTLQWHGSATDYEVVAVEGTWNEPAAGEPVTGTTATVTGLTPGTQYAIGLRAVCGEGLYSEWVVNVITTDVHPCYDPSNITASNITLTGATLSWTPGEEGQANFQLSVTTTGNTSYQIVNGSTYQLEGLLNATDYTVAVRAICGEGDTSDWSASYTFTTLDCEMVSGVAVSGITDHSATVSWTSNGSPNYEVGYGPIGTTTDNCTRQTVSTNSYTIEGLADGSMYVVYVRSVCAEGIYSDWTNPGVEFTTEESTGIDDVASARISLYPNPASSTVTLTGIEGEATVTVVDMNGRQVYSGNAADGSLTVDVSGMAQGAYFVRITGERVNAIRKLIVR